MPTNAPDGDQDTRPANGPHPNPAARIPQTVKRGRRRTEDARFIVRTLTRKSGGTTYLVTGFKRTGERVREQMQSLERARARCNELESQWIGRDVGAALRLTRLSPRELLLAEGAFLRLSDPEEMKKAIDFYLRFGTGHQGAGQLPALSEAIKSFVAWMDTPECDLREATRTGYRNSLARFAAATGDISLAEFTPDLIDATLTKKWPNAPTSRHGTRIALSRFSSWCMLRPRRWLASNPASGKLIATKPAHAMGDAEPEIFTLRQVMKLLAAGRRFKDGKFLRFLILSLFVGLRPKEAVRVRGDQPRLLEGELRIDPGQSKTGSSRTITLPDVAVAWLKVCPAGETFDWTHNVKHWKALKKMAKITSWPHDGLRHTAISYFFRAGGSYGLTAEWAGNSEGVIKRHYQGRVSTRESNVYWNLYPDRRQRAQALAALASPSPQETEPGNVIRAFSAPGSRPNRRLKASS